MLYESKFFKGRHKVSIELVNLWRWGWGKDGKTKEVIQFGSRHSDKHKRRGSTVWPPSKTPTLAKPTIHSELRKRRAG